MTSNKPANLRARVELVIASAKQLWTRYQISRSIWWRWTKAPSFQAPVRIGHTAHWNVKEVDRYLTRRKAKQGARQ